MALDLLNDSAFIADGHSNLPVLSLFEGEISVREAETDQGLAMFLRVKRLSNQKYLKEEITDKITLAEVTHAFSIDL